MIGIGHSTGGKALRSALLCGALLAAGFTGGSVWEAVSAPAAMVSAEALAKMDGSDPHAGADGDFAFFSYRRYLWVVKKSSGRAQFFHLPESASSDAQLMKSGTYSIDQEAFPLDQVRYQVSERNLTNYLWITNPVTGKARFIRATREGGFDKSPIIAIDAL